MAQTQAARRGVRCLSPRERHHPRPRLTDGADDGGWAVDGLARRRGAARGRSAAAFREQTYHDTVQNGLWDALFEVRDAREDAVFRFGVSAGAATVPRGSLGTRASRGAR